MDDENASANGDTLYHHIVSGEQGFEPETHLALGERLDHYVPGNMLTNLKKNAFDILQDITRY